MPDPTAFVARAREVLAKATPGPWELDEMAEYVMAYDAQMNVLQVRGYGYLVGKATLALDDDTAAAIQRANGEVSVLAVNSLPALLDIVEAATALLDYHDRCGMESVRGADVRNALARLEVPE